MDQTKAVQNSIKTLEQKSNLAQVNSQLFDNPLRREFLTFEQVVEFFGYSKRWVHRQMAEGQLPYRSYGRGKFFFYIPEVRQAILSGALAPIRKQVRNDYNDQDQIGNQISGSCQSEGGKTLQDLRREKRCYEMGEFC